MGTTRPSTAESTCRQSTEILTPTHNGSRSTSPLNQPDTPHRPAIYQQPPSPTAADHQTDNTDIVNYRWLQTSLATALLGSANPKSQHPIDRQSRTSIRQSTTRICLGHSDVSASARDPIRTISACAGLPSTSTASSAPLGFGSGACLMVKRFSAPNRQHDWIRSGWYPPVCLAAF